MNCKAQAAGCGELDCFGRASMVATKRLLADNPAHTRRDLPDQVQVRAGRCGDVDQVRLRSGKHLVNFVERLCAKLFRRRFGSFRRTGGDKRDILHSRPGVVVKLAEVSRADDGDASHRSSLSIPAFTTS